MKKSQPLYLILFSLLLVFFTGSCSRHQDIDTYLQKIYTDGKLNGNVLVIKNDTVLYENSFGYADAAKTVNLNKNFRFNIGSIYKEIPAVAIMQLHEEGKLELNDNLSLYVPDLPKWSDRITIKSLLQYSSGLPKMKFNEHFSNGITVTEKLVLNDLKHVKELEFAPETDYLYTNYSPLLLMKIVESITRQDFPSYAQQKLFDPHGLQHIKINRQYPYLDTANMAIPFNKDLEEDNYQIAYRGVLFSATTNDMYYWFKHLDSFDILSKESVEFLSQEAKSGRNIQAPLGYCKWKNNEISEHSHHGSSASYESLVRHHKKDRIMIILMTNQKQGNVHELADEIYELSL